MTIADTAGKSGGKTGHAEQNVIPASANVGNESTENMNVCASRLG